MTKEVGIYRGSFDPPHNGHAEAVAHALGTGLNSVTIIYEDTNRFKPFRTNNNTRLELLKTMFADMHSVIISQKPFDGALLDFQSDSTVSKIHQIVGSDILDKPVRPIAWATKLSYFIIPRIEFPIATPLTTLGDVPVKIGCMEQLKAQHHSSTQLRSLLFERNFDAAKGGFPSPVFDQIIKKNFYSLTDTEYKYRNILQEVKKVAQDEIIAKKIIPKEKFPLTLQLGNDIGLSGLSGDIICFVKDQDGQICLVIKIFLKNEYKASYQSELLGYKTIAGLNLKQVRVPEVFFSHLTEKFACIGMSFAKGKPLTDIMFDNPDAVKLSARANLELHLAQRVGAITIADSQIAFFEKALSDITKMLPDSEITTKLTKRFGKIRESFISNPGKLSFTHGDPNHSNWIVDLENNCVTYIDLSLFHRSVSLENGPYGFAINEFEESISAFKIIAERIGGISKEKVIETQNIYKNEYMSHAPEDITTREAQRYFSVYWSLRGLKNILKKNTETSFKDLQSQLQNIVDQL